MFILAPEWLNVSLSANHKQTALVGMTSSQLVEMLLLKNGYVRSTPLSAGYVPNSRA